MVLYHSRMVPRCRVKSLNIVFMALSLTTVRSQYFPLDDVDGGFPQVREDRSLLDDGIYFYDALGNYLPGIAFLLVPHGRQALRQALPVPYSEIVHVDGVYNTFKGFPETRDGIFRMVPEFQEDHKSPDVDPQEIPSGEGTIAEEIEMLRSQYVPYDDEEGAYETFPEIESYEGFGAGDFASFPEPLSYTLKDLSKSHPDDEFISRDVPRNEETPTFRSDILMNLLQKTSVTLTIRPGPDEGHPLPELYESQRERLEMEGYERRNYKVVYRLKKMVHYPKPFDLRTLVNRENPEDVMRCQINSAGEYGTCTITLPWYDILQFMDPPTGETPFDEIQDEPYYLDEGSSGLNEENLPEMGVHQPDAGDYLQTEVSRNLPNMYSLFTNRNNKMNIINQETNLGHNTVKMKRSSLRKFGMNLVSNYGSNRIKFIQRR